MTLPYPGIATDFQPILLAMLATADGTAIVTENVFESRFLYVGRAACGWAPTSGRRATTP